MNTRVFKAVILHNGKTNWSHLPIDKTLPFSTSDNDLDLILSEMKNILQNSDVLAINIVQLNPSTPIGEIIPS